VWYRVGQPLWIEGLVYSLLPSWWDRGYGITFGERFVSDADYRSGLHRDMARELWRRFPGLGIGEADPKPRVVQPDFAHAATPAAAGCAVSYPIDSYPWSRHLDEASVRTLLPPTELTGIFPYSEIVSQVAYLNSRLGQQVAPLFCPRGILNDALLLRGEAFFVDRCEDAEVAERTDALLEEARGQEARFHLSVPDLEHGTPDENLLAGFERCRRWPGGSDPRSPHGAGGEVGSGETREERRIMEESLQLIRTALQGRRPARTPIYDIFTNDAVIEHFGAARLDGSADEEVVMRAIGRALDGTREVLAQVPHRVGESFVDEVGNVREWQRWTHWPRSHAVSGLEQWVAWIEGHVERLEALSPPSSQEREQVRQRQLKLNRRLNGTVCIYATPTTAINDALFGLCGLEIFSYLWADHRELAQRWMRGLERRRGRGIELAAHPDTSPLAIIYSDIAYHDRLMFSRETFTEMRFFDDVAGICALCHQRGLSVIFHSDGNFEPILPDLVACGVDGINPIEKAAGMDVYAIRRRYPQLILAGGVDVTHLLPFGTPEQVRRETRRIIEETGSEGRLLIGSTTELGNDVPLANYLAFHEEVMRG
jgi:hypothetical protein